MFIPRVGTGLGLFTGFGWCLYGIENRSLSRFSISVVNDGALGFVSFLTNDFDTCTPHWFVLLSGIPHDSLPAFRSLLAARVHRVRSGSLAETAAVALLKIPWSVGLLGCQAWCDKWCEVLAAIAIRVKQLREGLLMRLRHWQPVRSSKASILH